MRTVCAERHCDSCEKALCGSQSEGNDWMDAFKVGYQAQEVGLRPRAALLKSFQ